MNGVLLREAAWRVRARARTLAETGGAAPSPCNSVCRMDESSGLCLGCLRTLDEIAAWGGMSDAGRQVCWAVLAGRARHLLEDPA